MENAFLLTNGAVILAFFGITWWYARFTSRLLKRCQQEVAAIEQRALANAAELQASYAQTIKEIDERRQVEDKFKESEARFAAFMRHFPGSATMRDLEGHYLFANESWGNGFELGSGEWLGKSLNDLWPRDQAQRFLELDKQVLDTRLPVESVETFQGEEAQHFWLIKRFPILNQDGQTVMVGDISLDITARRQAEDALFQEKEKYRILAEESPLGIAIISKKGTYKYLNPKFVEMFGYTLADIPHGRAWFARAFPDPHYRQRALTAWFEDLQPVRPWVPRPRTFTVACKDGAEKVVNFIPASLTNGDHLVIYEDMTARYRAQEALKQSENKYRTLVEQVPAVVFKGYADWSVEFFDEKIQELTGYAPEDFANGRLKWSQVILPEDLPKTRAVLMQALKGDRSYIREYRIRHKHGDIRWLQSRGKIICHPDGKIDYITGVFFDITRQKETEEALRAERDRLETVTRHMGAGLAVISKDHRILWANQVLKEAYGDLQGAVCSPSVGQAPEICLDWGVRDVLLEGREKAVHEFQGQDSQGGQNWWEFITTPVRGEQGEVDAALQLVVSITERKQAEEALRESEQRYRLLAENVRDVIWTADLSLKLTYVSPSVLLLTGYTPEEAMTKELGDVLTAASRDLALQTLTETLALEGAKSPDPGKTWTLELELICKDGSTVWTETKASFLREKEGQPVGILGVCRDISERKRTELALKTSEEKLRSLSYRLLDAQEIERRRLAAELHDELGHALLTLKLQIESLEMQLEPHQTTQKSATEQILRFIGETIGEVRRLYLDLSPGDLEDLGLTAALRGLIEDFAALRQEMTCTIDLDNLEGLFPLPAQTAIYRVVQEALTNIGKHANAKHVSLVVKRAGEGVSFCIEDDGSGLDAAKVLNAKRTLGLPAMEERVKFLGGSFELASQQDRGTRISFTIPF